MEKDDKCKKIGFILILTVTVYLKVMDWAKARKIF
jgi:hypothetical protein